MRAQYFQIAQLFRLPKPWTRRVFEPKRHRHRSAFNNSVTPFADPGTQG